MCFMVYEPFQKVLKWRQNAQIRAVDIMSRAMTSPVPGTTLDLLKFPVTRPEPHFINDRSKRLKQYRSAFSEKEKG